MRQGGKIADLNTEGVNFGYWGAFIVKGSILICFGSESSGFMKRAVA